MGPLDMLIHLAGFAAPALVLAPLLALAGRLMGSGARSPAGWWTHTGLNAVAGLVVLAAGLWHYGRDGKMMTYAALVVVMASTQWALGRAWRA